MAKFLIVGLGNIGEDYAGTRHNIGFDVLDELAKQLAVSFKSDRLGNVAEAKYKGKTIVLVKPNTFMNLSGKALNYWMQAEKIDIENVMVIVDDLALPFGKIRIGPKGGDGGHNGLKNIQETLQSPNYPRLRFGISNEFNKGNQVNYVLGKWSADEIRELPSRIQFACDAIKSFAFIGLERSMNQFNTK